MPLNPDLHRRLDRRFGIRGIANEGQRGADHMERRPGGGQRLVIDEWGESYRIDCPVCNETRGRLHFNWRYGLSDPSTDGRFKIIHLCKCFNENCVPGDRKNRKRLADQIFGMTNRNDRQQMWTPGRGRPQHELLDAGIMRTIELPTGCVPLDHLPVDHAVTQYVLSRGFDPVELARNWNVQYAPLASVQAANRMVIPILFPARPFAPTGECTELILAGWQARRVGESGSDRYKYLFPHGFQKSKVLYGLHMAVQTTGPVIICEGATDVWRAGPGAVAAFGKQLSRQQQCLIIYHFSGRPLVVMLDRDASVKAEETVRQLRMTHGDSRVVVGVLPRSRNDPGDCTREEISAAVNYALTNTA